MYAAFLYFKKLRREGFFGSRDLQGKDRTKLLYWLKKLVGAGWIVKRSDGNYQCLGYEKVWALLSTAKLKKKRTGRSFYRYATLKNFDGEFGAFKAHLLKEIRRHQLGRLLDQVKHRCVSGEAAKAVDHKPTMLCTTVAKHLGLKSPFSGAKYRKKFMNISQDYKLEKRISPKGTVYYKYPPGRLRSFVLSK